MRNGGDPLWVWSAVQQALTAATTRFRYPAALGRNKAGRTGFRHCAATA